MAVTCRDRLNKCLFLASARPRLVSFSSENERNRKLRRFPGDLKGPRPLLVAPSVRPIIPPEHAHSQLTECSPPCSARSLHHPPRGPNCRPNRALSRVVVSAMETDRARIAG